MMHGPINIRLRIFVELFQFSVRSDVWRPFDKCVRIRVVSSRMCLAKDAKCYCSDRCSIGAFAAECGAFRGQ